jgi:hypothetical protein
MLSVAVSTEGGGGQATTLANQPNEEPIKLDLSNLACLQRPTNLTCTTDLPIFTPPPATPAASIFPAAQARSLRRE